MSELLEEIKEEIKQEKVNLVLNKYGKLIALALLLGILSLILMVWWEDHRKNIAYQEGSELIAAVTDFKLKTIGDNLQKLEALAQGTSSYATIAKLHLATFYEHQKETDKAIALYDSIIQSQADQSFKDYAGLISINFKLKSGKSSPQEALDATNAYLAHAPIFKCSAQLLKASLHIKLDQKEAAKKMLDTLLDNKETPPGIQHIAELLRALVV